MKKAFTMIELIFVIVILGILAAVALPRIIATRDDAKIAAFSSDIMTALSDVAAHATAFNLEQNISAMSATIRGFENRGILTNHPSSESDITHPDFNTSVDISVGVGELAIADCIKIMLFNKENGNVSVLEIAYGTPGTGGLCSHLQKNIKERVFPMRLRGSGIVTD